jgi:hypothetical protein
MQMKEKICLTGLLTGDDWWVHHYEPESNRASSAMETSQFTVKLKGQGYTISWVGYT